MNHWRAGGLLLIMALLAPCLIGAAQGANIYEATLAETDQKTPEVSTEQMRQIVAEGAAVILDMRPRKEFAGGHIPSAQNLAIDTAGGYSAAGRLT
ncbi:MAG TPA: rhodanese-like domain-containing protein [Xanthobacteraceae bacterium]|nr:rhodanese-like domain-containing protein [Xanthobacteraceae bacterium]